MYINIDLNELAKEITRKIRDEISLVKIVDFGEVKNTTKLDNGGWTAQVLLPGAENLTNPLNCLSNYIPKVGDWVMIIYPPKSEPVLVDCTPMRANAITTPDDKYVSTETTGEFYTKTESDQKYAPITHDHDGRYYTKTLSDQRYATLNHNHDTAYAKIDHNHKKTWAWTAATLLGTWQRTDIDHAPPGYYEDIQGVMQIRGRASGGSLGSPIMQLPSGPEFIETRTAVSNNTLAVIEIHPDGNVVPVSGDPASWISLDGISIKL